MQDGHYDFCRGPSFLRVHVHGDSPAIIRYGHGIIGVQGDGDLLAVPGKRLVDRIIHDLKDHLMQTGAIIRIAYVHSRTLSHRVQTFQDLDIRRGIAIFFCHGTIL